MGKLPLIEKIHLLESRLGENLIHPLLEPFEFKSYNIIEVQEAGKLIAKHIGLSDLTFIISYSQQKSTVAGHINLNNSKDVFIEIDNKFENNYQIVLAILAHEICHKYLHINKIKLFPDYENEILTDITTVYTGLGKISLNGCITKSVSSDYYNNAIHTTTTTQKSWVLE